MPNGFSIREALQGHLHDVTAAAGFACVYTQNIIRDLAALLADYREEGTALFPEVFILSDLQELNTLVPSANHHKVGRFAIGTAEAASILKTCAGLTGDGWSIYIAKINEEFEFGVFRSQRHSIATSAEESMIDIGSTSPILIVRNCGHLEVELLDSSNNRRTISLRSSVATASPMKGHVVTLVESVLENADAIHRERMRDIPQRRAAITTAVSHFEATKGKPAHRGISNVIATLPEGYVVRVCYGDTKPPRRAWFRVPLDGSSIAELAIEHVQQYGETLWR